MPSAPVSVLLAAAMLPLSLAACASDPGGGERAGRVADGSSFSLEPGQQVVLADDSRLRYVRLVNDSRCAPGLQCVWAGDAVLAFEWSPASGAAQAFELHTGLDPRSHTVGSRMLTLESVEREAAPAARLKVEAAR